MHVPPDDPHTLEIQRRGFDSQAKARYITCAASCFENSHRVNSRQIHDETTLRYEQVTVPSKEVTVLRKEDTILREEATVHDKKAGRVCEEAALKTVHAP